MLLLVAPVANLKPGMLVVPTTIFSQCLRAQFELANVTAGGIDFLRNQRGAIQTSVEKRGSKSR